MGNSFRLKSSQICFTFKPIHPEQTFLQDVGLSMLLFPCCSRRSVAQSGRPSFPPSVTVPSSENVEDPFDISRMRPLIDLHDPPGIPLKPNLGSFYNLNPYPINLLSQGTTY